jgi:hypothetical protein
MFEILFSVSPIVAVVGMITVVLVQAKTISNLSKTLLQIAVINKSESFKEAKEFATKDIEKEINRSEKAIQEDNILMDNLKKQLTEEEVLENAKWVDM